MKIQQSEVGESFRSASGQEIYNQGQRVVSLMTKEGGRRDMKFTVCGVSRALGSVSQMCRTGYRVVLNPPWDGSGSYIQHLDTGGKMWMEERNGFYVLNTRVAFAHKQRTARLRNHSGQGFGWPGHL